MFLSSVSENGGGRKQEFGEFCWHDMASSSYVVTLIVLKAITDPQEVENVLKIFQRKKEHFPKFNIFLAVCVNHWQIFSMWLNMGETENQNISGNTWQL